MCEVVWHVGSHVPANTAGRSSTRGSERTHQPIVPIELEHEWIATVLVSQAVPHSLQSIG